MSLVLGHGLGGERERATQNPARAEKRPCYQGTTAMARPRLRTRDTTIFRRVRCWSCARFPCKSATLRCVAQWSGVGPGRLEPRIGRRGPCRQRTCCEDMWWDLMICGCSCRSSRHAPVARRATPRSSAIAPKAQPIRLPLDPRQESAKRRTARRLPACCCRVRGDECVQLEHVEQLEARGDGPSTAWWLERLRRRCARQWRLLVRGR